MKLREFKYTKPAEGTTPRKVLVFNDNGKYLEGVDLTKFSQTEQDELLGHVEEFEKKIADFVKRGWRRFKYDNISD